MLRLLVEGVQNIHNVGPSGEVNHAVGPTRVENSNLFDALADGWHRLKIVRLIAALDLIKLVTCVVTSALRKVSQALQRITKKRTGRMAQLYPIGYKPQARGAGGNEGADFTT